MQLDIHPGVVSDVDGILAYYEHIAVSEVADDFVEELNHFYEEACHRPRSFPVDSRGRRRVNLHRFPYHFLFRIMGDELRGLVVRHHRRHPSFGGGRR